MLEQVRQPVRYRAFRTVWAGETLPVVGDQAIEVAVVWFVLQATGSAGALAAVLLAQAVPRGVLLLVGGAVTDRLSPRTVMPLVTGDLRWAFAAAAAPVLAVGVRLAFDGEARRLGTAAPPAQGKPQVRAAARPGP